ncbi:MAG: DeoR/GlpR transcriptional regulator [Alphaproteobacteria bacterium]|nr:DeoR/GlpR transcriptional regulator [Alphaproteobacteria bacterium]
MHPTERQSQILNSVMARGQCGIGDLAAQMTVSQETIRRDVRALASQGFVVKVHGAIMVPERLREPPFERRMRANMEAKMRIAARCAQLIGDGESLMMDTGSTTCYVAKALHEHSNLTVVTNSVEIACALAKRNGNRVYMAGGELRGDDGAALGAAAVEFIRQFQVRYAILSIGAIDKDNGLMDAHLAEAEYSRTVIGQAESAIVVSDHSKFGATGFVKVCAFDAVDTLITDQDPSPAFVRRLAESGVTLDIA